MKISLEKDNQFFILSVIVAIVLTSLLSLIPIWQLVILAGIAAGLLNKTMKRKVPKSLLERNWSGSHPETR